MVSFSINNLWSRFNLNMAGKVMILPKFLCQKCESMAYLWNAINAFIHYFALKKNHFSLKKNDFSLKKSAYFSLKKNDFSLKKNGAYFSFSLKKNDFSLRK